MDNKKTPCMDFDMTPIYVLVTAARDEEKYIQTTIESVAAQTLRPEEWVIVSDGSKDRTDEIIRSFSEKHAFIRYLRIEPDCGRNFRSQVYAINAGIDHLKTRSYEFIGNVDADISLIPAYYERVLQRFMENPFIGLVGGWIHEPKGQSGIFTPRAFNSTNSVPHGVQLFRRQCFEEIGGYVPLPYGGPDWFAEVMARKSGWEIAVCRDLPVRHHKLSSSVEGALRGSFRQGQMDYSLGSHPIFEIFKCCSRMGKWPFSVFPFIRMAAFFYSYLSVKRPVSDEFVRFLRTEQIQRLRSTLLISNLRQREKN